MPITAAPGLPIVVRSACDLLLVDKRELMAVEILEPLFPRDWAKPAEAGEVEPDTGSAINDVQRCGTGGGTFPVCRVGTMAFGP